MSETKQYIQALFNNRNISIASNRTGLFEEYASDETNINAVKQIQENQKMMIDKWVLKNKIKDIIDKQLIIPNATVNKPYEATLDFVKFGMNDIVFTEFEGLSSYGLEYNNETEEIKGIPTQSGDFKVKLKFRVSGEPNDSELNKKDISLIINADPKSLWKDIPSIQTEDNYWKSDNVSDFQPIGNKHIVVASKRGRSHANVGSFRDDDYAFKYLENTGWGVVAVSDGAGSAKLSRKGSDIACRTIIDYFETIFIEEVSKEFDLLVSLYQQEIERKKECLVESLKAEEAVSEQMTDDSVSIATTSEPAIKNPIAETTVIDEVNEIAAGKIESSSSKISKFIYNHLGNAAREVHKTLEAFAIKEQVALKDLHSTLIFSLFKKYEFGYVLLSFGVGDCPIAVLNKDLTELKLMNWLDVGEFGGGTRFITMPEIFSNNKFPTRFGFKLIDDFSFLMLMTDGIYDAKFVVEANLEKIEKWKEFIDDLGGKNEDSIKVEFDPENKKITSQLSSWMDFWSPGNHDDRTLAIVF